MAARVEALRFIDFPTAPVEELLRAAYRLLFGLASEQDLNRMSRIREEVQQAIAFLDAIQLPTIHSDVRLVECAACQEATCNVRGRALSAAQRLLSLADELHDPMYLRLENNLSRLDSQLTSELHQARTDARARMIGWASEMIAYFKNLTVANAVALTQREWAPVIERLASR